MRLTAIIVGVALLGGAACSSDRQPTRAELEIARGVAALEADDFASAITAFTSAREFDDRRCEPALGLTLAYVLQTLATIRDFNTAVLGDAAPDPSDLAPTQSGSSSLVEDFLVLPLLLPLETALSALVAEADAATAGSCRLEVKLPLKLAFGSALNMNLQAGPEWTEREMLLLHSAMSALLSLDRLLLSHDLEIPPLTALKLASRIDTRNTVSLLRSLGFVPDEATNFLTFHSDPQRLAYFATVTELAASGLGNLADLARIARSFMDGLTAQTGREVIAVEDRDANGYFSAGDNLVFNVTGRVRIGFDTPLSIGPIALRAGASVRKELVDQAVSLLDLAATTFAGQSTPGTRLKLAQLNGIFQLFGQDRPFEDVLEFDPMAFFRGPLLTTWTRQDSNGNCATPAGEAERCTCAASRVVTDPSSGEPATVNVIPDIVEVVEGLPVEVCLRERLVPSSDARYPSPEQAQPLRAYLPYWFKDPFISDDRTVLGVEGEVSNNLFPGIFVPLYVAFGDFFHFLFGEVATDSGVVDLKLQPDCVAPPPDDRLGLVTIPYVAWREPTFNGTFFVNLGLLTGGECPDSQTVAYRVWNPPDTYALNKVTAHFYARYGTLIYDVFTFLGQ